MVPYNTKTDINFNSLIDWDRFPQLYCMFHQNQIFCAWGPPQVFEIVFLSFFYLRSLRIGRIKYVDHEYHIFFSLLASNKEHRVYF
jgi:hypothetical protein